MKLEDIGFYTLTDERAATASATSPLSRCELILTSRCNFRCPYCRSTGGEDISYHEATNIIKNWTDEGLQNIRFSGGEPTLYPDIFMLCSFTKRLGIERIAISTNGSAGIEVYKKLIDCGVNDFSVSLDACCSEDGDRIAGGIKGAFFRVTENIRYLSAKTYTTVGIVLIKENMNSLLNIIQLAHELNVSDIRIIPAAQNGSKIQYVQISDDILNKYPILKYRVRNIELGKTIRGIQEGDSKRCSLVLDDMAISQGKHYPCIIYLRESGDAIGKVGKHMRQERKKWYELHDTHQDPICKKNCLDVCIDYNNKVRELQNKCD